MYNLCWFRVLAALLPQLVESGKAFVQLEQERDSLRTSLEQLTRKCILILNPKFLFALPLLS